MDNKQIYSPNKLISISKRRDACVLAGLFFNMLDHAIPIASILDIPLITSEPEIVFLFKKFYPPFTCKLKKWDLPYLIENYSTVFYGFNIDDEHSKNSSFKRVLESFQRRDPKNPLFNLPIKFIYHFHGCSDKRWFDRHSHITEVDQVLFYGQHMSDLFKDIEVYDKLNSSAYIGNYRKAYYLKNKSFLDKVANREVFSKFKKKQFTILFAPTWADATNATSIFKAYKYILEALPDNFNLLLKLHPNLSRVQREYDPKVLYELLHPYTQKPNVQIVPLFPLVYPLLEKVDLYIGDYSSIGYDALSFDIPLFFINHDNRKLSDPTTMLFKSGHILYMEDLPNLYPIIEKSLKNDSQKYSSIRKKLYEYAFGKDVSFENQKKRFEKLLL